MTTIYFLIVVSLGDPGAADPRPRMAEIGWYESKTECQELARKMAVGSRAGVCLEGYMK